MSKVKYPDKEKIRNQIDIILDKSDLFNDSQDKTIHTDNKIVELKPVREKIPVMRVIQFVATAAAIVIFVVAVKNYSAVNKKSSGTKSQIPLATGSSDGPVSEYTRADSNNNSDSGKENSNLTKLIYGDIAALDMESVTSSYTSEYKDNYSYELRMDSILSKDGTTFYISMPCRIKKDGVLIDNADELIAASVHQCLVNYINATDVEWKEEVFLMCEINGNTFTIYIDGGKYDYANIIPE